MKDFFIELGSKIEEAVIEDFRHIRSQIGNEKIYAIVLATDGDCITLNLWVNTYEHLEKKDTEYGYHDKEAYINEHQNRLTSEEIDKIRNDEDYLTLKWVPDEYGYSYDGASGTVEISKLLFDKSKALYDEIDLLEKSEQEQKSEEMQTEFCELFLETTTASFLNLIQGNAFALDPEEVTYFIHMTDDDRTDIIAKESAKALNCKKVYEEFLKNI